jgi:hypothetical protein
MTPSWRIARHPINAGHTILEKNCVRLPREQVELDRRRRAADLSSERRADLSSLGNIGSKSNHHRGKYRPHIPRLSERDATDITSNLSKSFMTMDTAGIIRPKTTEGAAAPSRHIWLTIPQHPTILRYRFIGLPWKASGSWMSPSRPGKIKALLGILLHEPTNRRVVGVVPADNLCVHPTDLHIEVAVPDNGHPSMTPAKTSHRARSTRPATDAPHASASNVMNPKNLRSMMASFPVPNA